MLVAVLDAAPAGDPLAGFDEAWTLMAAGGVAVAGLALALGRFQAGAPRPRRPKPAA